MTDPQKLNDDVLQELERGSVEKATSLLDQGLKKWPGSLRLKLTRSDVLIRAGAREEAAEHLAALLDREEAARWAGPRLLTLVREQPLPAEVAGRLVKPVAAGALEERVKSQLLDALLAGRDAETRVAWLEPVARATGLFRLEWLLAVALTESCRLEEAVALLAESRLAERGTARSLLLEAELRAAGGHPEAALGILRDVTRDHPDLPDGFRRRIAIARRACRFEECAAVLEEALGKWPGDWSFPYLMNRVPLAPAALSRLFPMLEAAAAAPGRTERFAFQYALAALHAGRLEEAVRVLGSGFAEPTVAYMAGPVSAALGARSPEEWRAGSRLVDDRTRDVLVTRAEGAEATFVLTTGMAFGYLPLPLIDTLFAEQRVNVVYLRDFRNLAYLRGVTSLGPDEASTIAALRGLVGELGARRLVVVGASLGGYSSLRYGALLGADAAVSFSGRTTLEDGLAEARPTIWNPAFFVRQMWLAQGELPRDLVPVLADAPGMEVLHIHSAGAAEDVAQAQRIAHLPNVRLHAVPGVSDHYALDHMIGDDSFSAIIAALRDGRRWER